MRVARVVRDTGRAYASWLRAEVGRPWRSGEERSEGRSALLVTEAFPPIDSGGAFRTSALATYAGEAGWRLTVVASEPPARPSVSGLHLQSQVPDEVEVVRAPRRTPYAHARAIPRIDRSFGAALALLDAARELEERPSVVVASAPPFHSFATAFYLARALRLPLVLDFRDEWTECTLDFVRVGRWDLPWERRVLRAAARAVFISESQREHMLRTFPILEPSRTVVVANGWEPSDHPARDERVHTVPGGATRTLAFVGTFASFGEPERFLAALHEVLARRADLRSTVKVLIVGRTDRPARAALERFAFVDAIETLDVEARPRALERMVNADALLLLNPPGFARTVASKLYDYLATDRPVLVFGTGGEAAALVEGFRAGRVIEADAEALESALDDLVAGTLTRGTGTDIDAWLADHTRPALARRFFAVLDDVVEASG